MKIPLTLLNLVHQPLRTLIALAGVAFAILLVFMQLGFKGSAESAATILLSEIDFDLALISADYVDVTRAGTFPRTRLSQCLGVDGVTHVAPMYISGNLWRIVNRQQPSRHGLRRTIMVVGFDLDDPVFQLKDIKDNIDLLKVPGNVLIDTTTGHWFGDRRIGLDTDLGSSHVTIVGTYKIGNSYGADGMLLMSDQTFSRIFGRYPLDKVSLGLLQLSPGADPDEVARNVRAALPEDEVRLLTRSQLLDQETDFWINKTSVGKIFTFGVIVALVVGIVFVYQVLSSDVANRFPEYATLKAMGYSDRFLSLLVLQQACLYAVLGYVPGLILSLTLYELTASLTSLPIYMTWGRALAVFVLALGMCAVSGMLAMRKVKTADPADLF